MKMRSLLCWLCQALISSFLIAAFVTFGLLLFASPQSLQSATSILHTDWPIQVFRTISPLVNYSADLLKTLFPWPFVVLILGTTFLLTQHSFAFLLGLARLVRRVKLLGAEVQLTESERFQIKAAAADVQSAIAGYRKVVRDRVDVRVRNNDFNRRLGILIQKHATDFFNGTTELPKDFRCTIHIPDVAMQGYLYQLLNYFPDGGGAGRAFPQRYGIIGKVWRTGEAQVVGDLIPGGTEQNERTEADKIRLMVENWGMIESEARQVVSRLSYACYPIRNGDRLIGVLYMDSKAKNAFSTTDNHEETIERNCGIISSWDLVKNLTDLADDLVETKLDLEER